MDGKLPASSLQQQNVATPQPSRPRDALQGSYQQPSQLGSLQQQSQLGSLQQPSQLGSLQQPSQLGSLQQQSQLGSLQQPSQLGSLQQPSQLGSLQQPTQLSSLQQPTQLSSLQQPTQMGSLLQQPTQMGSLQQPSRPSALQGSFQQPSQLVSLQQPAQLGSLQQYSQMGALQQPSHLGSLQPQYGLARPLAPVSMQQLIKGDRGMLTLSDDNVMVNQILATHAPDGREVHARSLLHLVEDILNRASLRPDALITTGTPGLVESFEDKTHQAGFLAMLDVVLHTIDRISCELACKTLGGTDAHQVTLDIFHTVSYYAWDAKLVLTLAAFSLHYGEFWLLAQIHTTNQLAKAMALLRQVPGVLEQAGLLKPRLDALSDLIKAVLEVTRCVVGFTELPSLYITPDVPALSSAMAHIPTAVYWTIRSIVVCTVCATQITSFTSQGYESASTTEAWELSGLAHKLKKILEHLKEQLDRCYAYIDEKREDEYLKMLINLFEMTHIDNMKILRMLIYSRDDLQPLVDGYNNKKKVNLEVLRRKNVLLLISNLDITQEELSILVHVYNESRPHLTRPESQYEVVWIPIVDRSSQWTESMQKQFEGLQNLMPWYSVTHPSVIGKSVVKFIKERWHYRNKPILVVLDPQGKEVSPNAIHMIYIWQSKAFPFSTLREEDLWKGETWRLDLLVDNIDQTILNWMNDGKYIFLYGGDDVEWVRNFTNSARAVARGAGIQLEMIYVGKAGKREQVRRVIQAILAEKLSTHCWQEQGMIWFFWARLESMVLSKMQIGKADVHADPIMQEINKLLSHDDRDGRWAVLSRGSSLVVNGHGAATLTTLTDFDKWKENVALHGFDVAFRTHYDLIYDASHHCRHFRFSDRIAGKIPVDMRCPDCQRSMEKYTTFLCCHDEDIPNILYESA